MVPLQKTSLSAIIGEGGNGDNGHTRIQSFLSYTYPVVLFMPPTSYTLGPHPDHNMLNDGPDISPVQCPGNVPLDLAVL